MTNPKFPHFFLIVFAVFCSCYLLSGCSSSTTTTPPPTTVTPKSGTTYTYTKKETDSTSGKPATSTSDSVIIATVVTSGTTYNGKTNVVTLYDDFDTLRYQIESNNDVSIFRDQFGASGFLFTNPKPWMTLPFGSKNTGVTLFAFDTTLTVQSQPVPTHVVGTADYISADNVPITGKSNASGGQVKTTITITGTLLGSTITIVSTQTYSFDLSIGGYFHSISNTTIPDVTILGTPVLQGSTSLKTKILTDYNLK